jgi:hypothetical protein
MDPRVGELLPKRRLLTLCSLMKITDVGGTNFWDSIPAEKNVVGNIMGDFFHILILSPWLHWGDFMCSYRVKYLCSE